MRHLLALDAGTGSGRAVLFDEEGRQLASAGREWTHREEPGHPGSMTFERERNWERLADAVREVLAQVPEANVAAVSTTSMREGIVLYDEQGRELWACANVDARAVREVRELRERDPELERWAYLRSGQTFALGAAPRLLWLERHEPELYERAARLAMLSDWIAVRLGAEIALDPTNGGTTGLFDLATRRWDPELFDRLGIKPAFQETPVREVGTVIGEVSPEAAAATGLEVGTPIVMGGGDAQLGTVGLGVTRPGEGAILGGSFWQQEVNLDGPRSDASGRMRLNFAPDPAQWQAEAIVFFPGIAARWFRDALAPDLKERAAREGRDAYALLEELAATVPPGSHGITPILSDAMDYSHWRHAAPSFLNFPLDPEKAHRGAFFRALQENAALVTRANLERIAALTGAPLASAVFAGGAAKGRLWPQIVADVLQIPLKIPVVKEATALGAAIAAAVGVGIHRNLEEGARAWVAWEREVEPDPALAEVYDEAYRRWKAAYPAQLDLADRGVTRSMWRAPGE
ncbi:autoinducer-2 kinase [Oceanithermus profundus]